MENKTGYVDFSQFDVEVDQETQEATPTITKEKVYGAVQLAPNQLEKAQEQAKKMAAQIADMDPLSDEFQNTIKLINSLSNERFVKAAEASKGMLTGSVNSLRKTSDGSKIASDLVSLGKLVDKLDPSTKLDIFKPKKLLERLPFFGDKVTDYFRGFESNQEQLDNLIKGLDAGKDLLEADIDKADVIIASAKETMQGLEYDANIALVLGNAVEAKAKELDKTDPEKAKALRGEILSAARQKYLDIVTQQAVNIQGYAAQDLIRKNNRELVKAVERAKYTTVSALETAVVAAEALNNQTLVLESVQALQKVTGNVIANTAKRLALHAGTIQDMASNATISPEILMNAFADTRKALESVSDSRIKGIVKLEKNALALSGQVKEMTEYVQTREALASGFTTKALTSEKDTSITQPALGR